MSAVSSQSEALAQSFFEGEAARWADRYQSPTYRQRRQLVRGIVKHEALRANHHARTLTLLDFGCGAGILLKDAADLGLSVTGVDTSKAMIDAARDQFVDCKAHVNLEWLRSSSGEGNYQKQEYDIVLCASVLEFVPDCTALFWRLCARVSPGGILIASVPNRNSWLRRIEAFIHGHPQLFRRFAALDYVTGANSYLELQTNQLTRDELLLMARCEGLIEEQHRFHVAPRFLRWVER